MDTNSKSNYLENNDINKDENRQIDEHQKQTEEESIDAYYEVEMEKQHNQDEESNLNNEKKISENSEKHVKKKMNQSDRFVPRTFITVVIILFLAILSVSSYVPVRDKIFSQQDYTKRYAESYNFYDHINTFSKHLAEEFHEELTNETKDNDSLYYYQYKNIDSIKYHITDSQGRLTLSNLESNTISKKDLDDAKFFLQIKTDEDGNITLEHTDNMDFYGRYIDWSFIPEQAKKNDAIYKIDKQEYENMTDEEKEAFKEELADTVGVLYIQDENGSIQTENLNNELLAKLDREKEKYTNLEITYLVNDDILQYNDIFARDMRYSLMDIDGMIIFGIGVMSTLILIIIAFSIRYSFQRKVPVCSLFNKMYLELKVLSYAILIPIGNELVGFTSGYIDPFITNAIINTNAYFYGIGITVVFIFFTLLYLLVVYIKHIYYHGIKEGLIKNSLIGRIIIIIGCSCYRFVKQLMSIDVNKNTNRKLILIASISVIGLLLLAMINPGPFVIFLLAMVYAALLFRSLMKLIEHVKLLNEASTHLAEDNFDINLDEDIGILSPVAKNLNNIKNGFSTAVNKATKSQKMKTELISNVSHDLKTPLTSIITYVDLLKNNDIDPQTQIEYVEILDKKAKRLKVLIEDLFEASKASSGNIELQLEILDVNALFRQTLGELEEKINNSTLIIRLNAPENKIMCRLDGRRTYRIFENIMNNILKYSMKGSRVYIDIADNEKDVQFIFKNISQYEMTFDVNDITERFTRGDRSRNTDGSGLGLAIAKTLVELQNGKLIINIDGDLFKLMITFPKEDSIMDETIEE